MPNAVTKKAMSDATNGKSKKFKNADAMFRDLND